MSPQLKIVVLFRKVKVFQIIPQIYVRAMFDTLRNATAGQSVHSFVRAVLDRGVRSVVSEHSRHKRSFGTPDDGGAYSQ